MLKILLAIGLVYSGALAAEEKPPLPPECRENCAVAFGQRLGASPDGTESYSNCQAKCVYQNPAYVGKNYAGLEWQCVEYARRWLMRTKGLTFPSIDFAADLWNKVDHLVRIDSGQTVPMRKVLNGASSPPQAGDLLIYGREYLDTGHVAVVLKVDKARKVLQVAEQNFRNTPWPGTYSRKIPFQKVGKAYWVLDAYLIGWKHY